MDYELETISSEDREEIVEIFNFYVENSFAARGAGRRVLGFGLLRPHHPMPTFSAAAEISIFMDPEFKGRGIGTSLVERLVDEAKRMRLSSILAGISSRNDDSIAFHGSLGFIECSRILAIRRKWGESFDVVWMQRML